MIYQQYTTAILEAYRGHREAADHLEAAREFRGWIESLAIEEKVRNALVEQAVVIEEAFERAAS